MEAGIEPKTYLTANHCANFLTNAVALEKENKGLQESNPGLLGHEVAAGPLSHLLLVSPLESIAMEIPLWWIWIRKGFSLAAIAWIENR